MSVLLNFGLPKGSLEEATLKLFARAGFSISKGSRSYTPSWDDPEIDGRFVRAQEMSRYVEDGFFDCGLTGRPACAAHLACGAHLAASAVVGRAGLDLSRWRHGGAPVCSPASTGPLAHRRIAAAGIGVHQAGPVALRPT